MFDRIIRWVLFWLAWTVATGLAFSVRLRDVGRENMLELIKSGEGGIVMVWHGSTILPIFRNRNMGLYSIVSVSRDGELQAKLLKSRGFKLIRGSSRRESARAMLGAMRALRDGGVLAMTPDGPRGPAGVVQPGPVQMARRAKARIVPVGLAIDRCWRLRSWDSHIVPKPFAKAVLYYDTPVTVGEDETDEAACTRVQEAINNATVKASEELSRVRTKKKK